jgi:ketosteroid isomerase-like protein
VGIRSTSRSLNRRRPNNGQTSVRVVRAVMGARRYTPRMGAVETMEDFFEKLNTGDREAAVALMDEKTEMRVHVGDSVQTLRGVERVGGWFLRGEKGLKMIPGEIRDTGNTWEADLLVVRPGAQSQHIDATFRVEAGKITAINIAPR